MTTVQYGASAPTYQLVERNQGKKQQRVNYEFSHNPVQEERSPNTSIYELKIMNRFGGPQTAEAEEVTPPKASHPERNPNVNQLDLNRDGALSNFEIKLAQSNKSQLSAGAMALLKKIVEHQAQTVATKQTYGLDPNNGHSKNVQAHMARMDRPAFMGNIFSA